MEAAAWLHDIGRARTHERRHTIEGFRLLAAEGHPGYAPPCVSHYTKGRTRAEVGDDEFGRELWSACDLETFGDEERLIALADGMAARDKRVRLEARYDDLRERYGASPFLDRSLQLGQALLAEFEERSGKPLYRLLGI